MEKIIESLKRRPKATSTIDRDNILFQTILTAIQDKKGEKVVSLDLRNIEEAVSDFFILCEAGSHIQIKAIADHIEETVTDTCEERPYHVEQGEGWIIVDYVNVVVHIFQPEERRFYDLEGLWLDSIQTEHHS